MKIDGVKHILIARPDNMGDVLMSMPAICALKDTYGCKTTLLTSTAGAMIARYCEGIDEIMICDLPWVKHATESTVAEMLTLVKDLRYRAIDLAVIFTVYSQSALPTAQLLKMAGIEKVAAYSRENPYGLIDLWVPDEEPYSYIKHQVRRDIALGESVGAICKEDVRYLKMTTEHQLQKHSPYIIFHTGASEERRTAPQDTWCAIGKKISAQTDMNILLTGTEKERGMTERIAKGIGTNAESAAGSVDIGGLIALIRNAALVISVNTASAHIAAAAGTPVIVLYALTNPQHFPWKGKGAVFTYNVAKELWSRNEVVRYVQEQVMLESNDDIDTEEVANEALRILNGHISDIPELPLLNVANHRFQGL